MLAIERRKLFLDLINENGIETVTNLARKAKVTEETVRRDLQALESSGLIIKTHGGAIPKDSGVNELSVEFRQNVNIEKKMKLAKKAIKHIDSGDTIFLDASTTTLAIARLLNDIERLTVITNSLQIINELKTKTNIQIICMGGNLFTKNQSFVGSIAEHFIKDNYHINKMFFSCKSLVSDKIMLESNEQEAAIKKEMLRCSDQTYLLFDSTKINRQGHVKLGELSDIDTVITDYKLDTSNYKNLKVELI